MEQIITILYSLIITLISHIYLLRTIFNVNINMVIGVILFLAILLKPTIKQKKFKTKHLQKAYNGYHLLLMFLISWHLSFLLLYMYSFIWHIDYKVILINSFLSFCFEFISFLVSLFKVSTSSKQLGIKYKLLGVITGLLPIIDILVLGYIIKIVKKEVIFENEKILLNERRSKDLICKTKYPIILVHGVFFRDFKFFDYWGRIPHELKINGAKIYYGNNSSALSIKDSAKELKMRIEEILEKEHTDKVNIIAHSKGGLDARYVISEYKMEKHVASLTMINTPNRGCIFADYLLSKMPKSFLDKVATTYNFALRHLGDKNPDFESAVKDLTSSHCVKLNRKLKKSPKVYYQSFGSKLIKSNSARFPLNLTTNFVKYFDGDNDGLVGEDSFSYGDKYEFLVSKGSRGISHGDMIDLNRENIDGFDVREFYVKVVSDLKDRGF